ncbi:MAG: ATP-binding protein [Bacillota bacterium]|nr:ATP-binding protein [Bacillota bacterium]
MLRTLRARLLLCFMAVSLIGVAFFSTAIQFGFQDSFSNYLDAKRDSQVQQVVQFLEAEYRENKVITGVNAATLLHQQAMTENLYYRVFDKEGNIVVDSTSLMGMMEMMNNMMTGSANTNEQKLLSKTYPLEVEGELIGTLEAIAVGGYVETDFEFLGQINKYIIGAALTTIVIAIILSIIFSKTLTKALNQLREAAKELKGYNLAVRIPLSQQQPEELRELAIAFNELAESLEGQEKLRKQFTQDLAHELRTPLATLRSQLEAFQDMVWQPTPERLKQSHQELMRLVRLVNDLEKLLAAENPQILLKKQSLEVGQLLHSLQQQFLPAFKEHDVELELGQIDKQLWILADKDRLIQILTNLINNALKYTPPGGVVSLSAMGQIHPQLGSAVSIEVADTGMGISQEDLPHVIERFYRGDKSRNRQTGGIGIGLSIVSALVQAHKGKIEIESELGKGTKITVCLPNIKE